MMDIIQSAIYDKRHITENIKLTENTWRKFKRCVKGRRLYLFGAGAGCEYFLKKYGRRFSVALILDNDSSRKGKRYPEFSKLKKSRERAGLLVETPDILKRIKPEEAAVLITSTKYYEEIADQLEKIGICNYYSLCIMEAGKISVKLRQLPYYVMRRIKEKTLQIEKLIFGLTGWNRYVVKQRLKFYRYRKYAIQKNKIVFHTFGEFSGHGKYIAKALQESGKKYDIVWIVRDKTVKVPNGIRKILQSSEEQYAFELTTAKVWVNDIPFPRYAAKRKGQYYIQTKHWAGVTLKKFYLDAPTLLRDIPKIKNWEYNGKIMDFIITGSSFDTDSCRRGFHFKGEAWQIGSPRSDLLFSPRDYHGMICDRLNISRENRLLLYAPTYRFMPGDSDKRHEARENNLDYKQLNQALERKFGGNWMILLRLHPSVAKALPSGMLEENVWNASEYEDSQELVAACEIMISDYSSIMFESCFVGKPVFLFASDLERYQRTEYDFLIGIKELPFPLAETNEELIQNIEEFDEAYYNQEVNSFLTKYGVHEDGQASRRAAERIMRLMSEARPSEHSRGGERRMHACDNGNNAVL